jgi:hypothetical protein
MYIQITKKELDIAYHWHQVQSCHQMMHEWHKKLLKKWEQGLEKASIWQTKKTLIKFMNRWNLVITSGLQCRKWTVLQGTIPKHYLLKTNVLL